ncbi:hypothetical protein Pla123a_16390 [Posidoniimonas polymericola]|uniref:Uncharacterized protein n=1 Tax=Posidoniimonas polymericola TaxID=2528002 RepID=A0A5C5YSY2_9BACT|nr:hypothetical protein [Posidoniimonas polymericola]TWT77843.1 hypothetical protein Pla123a_16390 [Posidoniimonas polymericola]
MHARLVDALRSWLLAALAAGAVASAAEPTLLIDPARPTGGWSFDNGREFPGAVGSLELTERGTLDLHFNFTGGGAYVQAATGLPSKPVESVAFEIKAPAGVEKVTLRLIDETSQCHQLDLRIEGHGEWQRVRFPIDEFFASMRAGAPLDIIQRYEKWGGANDGRWHQPGRTLVVLVGRGEAPSGVVSLRGVTMRPAPPTVEIQSELDLIGPVGDRAGWRLTLGPEYPGAKGSLDPLPSASGKHGLALEADLSGGGRYVGAECDLGVLNAIDSGPIELEVRSEEVHALTVRLVDATGQTHQRRGFNFQANGEWQTLTIDPQVFVNGEHWAGANDGQWHGPLKTVVLMLNAGSSDAKSMRLEVGGAAMRVTAEATVSEQAWNADFAAAEPLQGWSTHGDVQTADARLRLTRSLDQISQPTTAAGPGFEVNAGVWQVGVQWRSALESPDNSYHGAASLEVFDRRGDLIESFPIGIVYGEADWRRAEQHVTLPRAAASARFVASLQKTHGEVQIDELSARRLEVQPARQTIESVRIASAALGNLFYPGDPVEFQVEVRVNAALADDDQRLRWVVKDYRGAEQTEWGETRLEASGAADAYRATVRVPMKRLHTGQFYELHVAAPQGVASPVEEYSGFAVLPKAAAKAFAPEQIPFTIRNWDGRIGDYVRLADRLGLRVIGLWGGWSSKPPHEPHLNSVELCEELGAKWATGTPAASIERSGFEEYSPEALRQGMTNFLEAYADRGLAMIWQGNEPHGKGQKVLDNVRAYQAIYESAKAFDPAIEVVGTSVEPNREYFEAGYYRYLDSYDFHIYEHYENVRRTIREYRALMEEFDAIKPIHSSELGLNSQGIARSVVASELIKKCTVFFAEGGATVSWFTILYPDPKGQARGRFGDAHCVFDCKHSNYNARLDAVAYYNMINGLLDKRFVAERSHDSAVQAFLFKQGDDCLQVLWSDDRPVDHLLAVPTGVKVTAVRLDGRRSLVDAVDGRRLVTVSKEPVLLLYRGDQADLD